MDKRENQLKNDFKHIQKDVLAILLYGSYAKGESEKRSDIDICIVAPHADKKKLYRKLLQLSNKNYDIKFFEDMPLFLKIEVIQNHKILYTKNVYDLYEYFYSFRKIWKDQAHRQKLSKEEMKKLFS